MTKTEKKKIKKTNLLPEDLCHKERPAHERQSIEEDDPTEKDYLTENDKGYAMASCRVNLLLSDLLCLCTYLSLSLSLYLSSPDVEYAVAKCKLQGKSCSLARSCQGCDDPSCRCSQVRSNLVIILQS